MYICGKQMDTTADPKNATEPFKLELPTELAATPIDYIACSFDCAAIVTKNDQVWVHGENGMLH